MPTYNGEKYIREQLESILMQLGDDDEVIISDDCSTDKTLAIIESLDDSRVKVYTHDKINNPYKGHYKIVYTVCKNVENALRQASGDYIFLSDQDDIWLPGKVEAVVTELDKGYDIVQHDATIINQNRNITLESMYSTYRPIYSLRYFLYGGFFQGASMAFTSRLKDMVIPLGRKFPIGHDHQVVAVALANKLKMSYINQSLLLYRRHDNNVSYTSGRSRNSFYFKLSYRFNQLYHYFYIKFCR